MLAKHYNVRDVNHTRGCFPVFSEQLFVTSGATSGLFLVASLMIPSQAIVFVKDPTYFIAIDILRDDIGFNVIPGGLS